MMPPVTLSPLADLDEELWRHAQARREAAAHSGGDPLESVLVSLTLSLARLCAQRDARRQRAMIGDHGAC